MLSTLYLLAMLLIGDILCRRFFGFRSIILRLAGAFIVGLLTTSWFTYLIGLLFRKTLQPLFWADLVFFVAAAGFWLWSRQWPKMIRTVASGEKAGFKTDKWDLLAVGMILVLTTWMMFSTLNMSDGKLEIANHQWSDFGPNVAIMQSFAFGNNFPTEYPHFSGDRIRYHFLFYFQAGNLEYLGWSPAFSINVLSVLSVVSMLIFVMALGVVLFKSRAAGWLAAGLFFFHGSLAYIPFLFKKGSISDAVSDIWSMKDFLPSGFTYRGEDWGVWSQVVFLNQRHLASAIGILLLVILFLLIRYRAAESPTAADGPQFSSGRENFDSERSSFGISETVYSWIPFIFAGLLLGLLPLWNGAVFTAAFATLACLFVLFPLRLQMALLGITAGLIALPQIIFLKTGNIPDPGYSFFHFGYVVENPTIFAVIAYLFFTFGLKWLLLGIGLYFSTNFERKFFIATCSLFILTFFFQFSVEVLANHKFLNIWLVMANIFAAYGAYRIWTYTLSAWAWGPRLVAGALLSLVILGGVLDLFPIKNSYWMVLPFRDDRLISWLRQSTDPKAIFLTDRFVTHGILLAGRRVFHGHTYYTWGAGYPASERDAVYTRMFEERQPQDLLNLLKANKISYAAIDNSVRTGGFIKNLNEDVYDENFEQVFQDDENIYNGLKIFKITDKLMQIVRDDSVTAKTDTNTEAVGAFDGGQGHAPGQFDRPRGIAVDGKQNIFVADSGNSRIQKFSPDGKFVSAFGKAGTKDGEIKEPTGIAVDSKGMIYITDAGNNKLLKFKNDGAFVKQWTGPDPGFYGPRDIAVGPDDKLYILDQGRGRVVRFDPASEHFMTWGEEGTDDGKFTDMTGIVVGEDRVFIADAQTDRIQVFDLQGNFVRRWNVEKWAKYIWHRPDIVVDSKMKRVYVSSGWSKEILIYDLDGNFIDSLKSGLGGSFTNPSSVALTSFGTTKRLLVLDTGSDAVQTGGAKVFAIDLVEQK